MLDFAFDPAKKIAGICTGISTGSVPGFSANAGTDPVHESNKNRLLAFVLASTQGLSLC